ncbi:MAG TPA: NADPH-dependent FMN reductase [Gemmatimonadaceae bacterium]|nr:NADPH-dependent FMN reductase [Gemmatimonadaceae bacterium]
MHVLAISGSLRAGSSNTAVLEAARLLAPAGVAVSLYDGLAALPAFDPDVEESGDLPRAVRELRRRVAESDALMVCSPEYAHGFPGSLKNLLDWLVGSVDFPGTPVALVAASERSVHAQAQLAEVLRTMSARLVPAEAVVVPLPGRSTDAAAIAADARLAGVLRDVLAGLRHAAEE